MEGERGKERGGEGKGSDGKGEGTAEEGEGERMGRKEEVHLTHFVFRTFAALNPSVYTATSSTQSDDCP